MTTIEDLVTAKGACEWSATCGFGTECPCDDLVQQAMQAERHGGMAFGISLGTGRCIDTWQSPENAITLLSTEWDRGTVIDLAERIEYRELPSGWKYDRSREAPSWKEQAAPFTRTISKTEALRILRWGVTPETETAE